MLSIAALSWAVLGRGGSGPLTTGSPVPVSSTPPPDAPDTPPEVARTWPPLFGATPEVPPAPPPPEPAPPPLAMPDLALTGVLVGQDDRLAILTVDGVERVVREGDTLAPSITVAVVALSHVEISVDGRPLRLDFAPGSDGRPPPTVEVELPPVTVSGVPQVAGFRVLSDAALAEILEAAGVPGEVLPK